MSNRKIKELRRGYKEAAALYWTKDMEEAIRGIHKARISWKIASIVEAVILAATIGAFLWIR